MTRPPKSAPKQRWVQYVSLTYDVALDIAQECSRQELIDACDAAEAQAVKEAADRKREQSLEREAVGRGPVELATLTELRQDHLDGSALAASAVRLARHVDQEESASAAAAAARELRMTLSVARSALLARNQPNDTGEDDDDGVVVGPNRLLQLREKAGGASGR